MPGRSVLILLGFFVFAFVLDGINSYLSLFPGAPNLYEPQNWLRLLTGSGMGLAMAAVILPAFNQTTWRQPLAGAAFPGVLSVLPVLFLVGLVNVLVLTENPLLLYPLALVSAVGVLGLLTLVYAMVWMLITRHENLYHSLKEMSFFLLAGFGTAILQVILLDAARFLLTGTWDGFHLG